MRSHGMCILLTAMIVSDCLPVYGQYFWAKKLDGDHYSVSFNPRNPQTVYSGSYWIWVSYDAGEHWKLMVNQLFSTVRFISSHPADTTLFYTGTDLSLARKTGESRLFTRALDVSYDGESIAIDPDSSDKMYTAAFIGGVYVSRDRGTTWKLSPGTDIRHYCSIALRKDSSNILYVGAGAGSIMKSTDYGLSWRTVDSTASDETPKIVIDPQNPLVAYATRLGLPEQGVRKTTDGGETWFWCGLHGTPVWSLDIDPRNSSSVYVGSFGEPSGGRMFHSTDGGQNWQDLSAGLPPGQLHWMVKVAPVDTLLVFAALDGPTGGLYKLQRTPDLNLANVFFVGIRIGGSWTRSLVMFNGTGTTHIDSIRSLGSRCTISRDTLTIPPMTTDSVQVTLVNPPPGGNYFDTLLVWSRDFPSNPKRAVVTVTSGTTDVSIADPVPEKFALSNNTPNPFNPETGFRFQVSGVSFVTVKVYDVLGREIQTLVNEVKQPGTYAIRFDGSRLASGVYFVRMNAGHFSAIRKIVLLR